MTSLPRTAVLHVDYGTRASYYDDWLDAFTSGDGFAAHAYNIAKGGERSAFARDVGEFELIVSLHSVTADSLIYADKCRAILQGRSGRLLSFVGNEMNLPWAPLGSKIDWLQCVQPDFIATQLLPEAGKWLYAGLGARVIDIPHALNPSAFHATTPQAERRIDIGTRSFRYLAYLGDDDRNRIYDYFVHGQFEPPLLLDFSTENRFDREGWSGFLNGCKATISTEAGSWYLERDDATVTAIRRYIEAQSGGLMIATDGALERVARLLPYRVRAALRGLLRNGFIRHEAVAAEEVDFEDIYARFFAERDRSVVYGKCISSRHFDAIGAKTCQIMFPGRFNDILKADEHYIALAPDFSNIDDVLTRFRDPTFRQAMADRSYEYVLDQHTHTHRLSSIRKWLG